MQFSAITEAGFNPGFNPAIIVETSPRNLQAWLKHPERVGKELSTAAARAFSGENSAVIAAPPTGGTVDVLPTSRTNRKASISI
jgi:histidinol dehydrogenase